MIHGMKKWATAALSVAVLTASMAAHAAREVAGVQFEDQVTIADQPLQLNGVGLRVKMIIKVYAMGLYTPRRDTSPVNLMNQVGPKSIRIVMLRDVSANQLVEGLITGITDNTSTAEMTTLRARVDELEAAMMQVGEVRRGSVIQLDYVPMQGTRITVSGKPMGRNIAGDDFYRALLRIWLGDRPSDKDLKRGLLGTS